MHAHPECICQLQSFLGLVTVLDNLCEWRSSTNAAFQKINSHEVDAVQMALHFSDRSKPVKVHIDTSQCRIKACILQEGWPIALTSKSLSEENKVSA